VRYAVAFHDAGRKGDGVDLWEADSAKLCAEYVQSHVQGISPDEAGLIGDLICKGPKRWGEVEKRIVHDADVLDIMRPCCGHGGFEGFNPHALRFLSPQDNTRRRDDAIRKRENALRVQLIDEAWAFIQMTENIKISLRESKDYMHDMMKVLQDIRDICPLLAGYLL
jgi:hypothetical protein